MFISFSFVFGICSLLSASVCLCVCVSFHSDYSVVSPSQNVELFPATPVLLIFSFINYQHNTIIYIYIITLANSYTYNKTNNKEPLNEEKARKKRKLIHFFTTLIKQFNSNTQISEHHNDIYYTHHIFKKTITAEVDNWHINRACIQSKEPK